MCRTKYVFLVLVLTSFNVGLCQPIRLTHSLSDTTFVGSDKVARFNKYAAELNAHDINIKLPDNFSPIDMRSRGLICYNINENWDGAMPGNDYCPVAAEADNNEALILYPNLLYVAPQNSIRSSECIAAELRMSLDDNSVDILPMLNVITNDDKSKYAGADTVIIYKFDFRKPFLDQYKHCIGVYLRSYGHHALQLKIALTDKGYKNAEDYIEQLINSINYGSSPLLSYVEAEEQTKGYNILMFPKQQSRIGLLPEVDIELLDELNRVREWCRSHGITELPRYSDEVLDALNNLPRD